MNNYLLTAGQGFYPEGGTGDWINTFESEAQAQSCIKITQENILFKQGKRKGQIKETKNYYEYYKNGQWHKCDWYEIIDLRKWIDGNRDPWIDIPLTKQEQEIIKRSINLPNKPF